MADRKVARVSNTGLHTDTGVYPVASGVDTLKFSIRCKPSDTLMDALGEMRSREVSAAEVQGRQPLPVLSGLSFADQDLLLLPFGRKSWRYVLTSEQVDIQLGRGGVSGIGAVITLRAAYLWEQPLSVVCASVRDFVCEYLGEDAAAALIVSEVHLARDVAGMDVARLWSDLEPGMVKRADKVTAIKRCNCLQSVQIGSRGSPISALLYDKLAELSVSHKLWFRDIWQANGWDGEAPVWRMEFRLRRDFLRSAGVNTMDDLLQKLGELWAYAAGSWLRHTDGEDQNVSRRPVSIWWRCYSCSWDGENHMPCTREVQRNASAEDLIAQAAGCVLGAGALVGLELREDLASLVLPRFDELLKRMGSDDLRELIERKRRRYGMSA